ncbi:MAG: right-handed parallel beta-helix repeat-containing protein, partial [Clostridia bacterium]|nr:right-handed parallel beta-helix repeat-containing protein [Clostridia bacterium]
IHNDGNSNTVDIRKCSNIVIRDLEISVVGADHTEGTGSVAGINLQYDMIGETKYENIYVVNNEVHGTDVEKNVMGITLSSCCDDIATRPINGVSNINVLNNTVYDVGRSGITAFGWIIEISGTNTFHDTFKDICITGNTVHNVGNIGIYIAGCTGSELNRNTVYNSGMRENAAGSEGMCGIMVLGCSTSDIMFNVCYDNQRANGTYDAMGIDIDWNCTNINVQYNHCYENDGAGIGTMACQNSFIRNNRIENNRCITNNEGQINLMDFTSRNHGVAEDMHKVKNLTVENNLVIGTPEGTAFFRVKHENGDFYHENNSFKNNRIVYTGSEGSLITWIEIDAGLSWYEFSRNRYYSADDLSVFNCMDYSKKALINTENGANRYSGKRTAFEDWLQREPDAQFAAVTGAIPSAPENIDVSWSQGKLNLTWDAASGDLWHYNIYSIAENEEISYLNMLGETEGTEFSFAPEYTGTFRIVVQAESNEGICSDLAQAKVTLK